MALRKENLITCASFRCDAGGSSSSSNTTFNKKFKEFIEKEVTEETQLDE